MPRPLLLAAVLLLAAPLACRGQRSAAPSGDGAEEVAPEAPRVSDGAANLYFRFRDRGSGKFKTASSPSEVPDYARGSVVVYDMERDRPGWFFVADLSKARPDGSYPCEAVQGSLLGLKLGGGGAREAAGGAPGGDKVVRLYSASWCGACNKARAFLKREDIPFVEKDVEKDPGASAEISAAARRAGIDPSQLSGVPIIVVGDEVMMGFDPKRVLRLAGR